jgi:hypothetical protein
MIEDLNDLKRSGCTITPSYLSCKAKRLSLFPFCSFSGPVVTIEVINGGGGRREGLVTRVAFPDFLLV